MSNLNFVAIDFETANNNRNSACSVALVRVESGQIVDSIHRLIQPPELYFQFTYIHGITAEKVSSQPFFSDVWNSVLYLTENMNYFFAHNAPFDKSVLHACCSYDGIRPPQIPFQCTVNLARRKLNLSSNKLPDVCNHLGISLNHHDALSDATACAKIAIALS